MLITSGLKSSLAFLASTSSMGRVFDCCRLRETIMKAARRKNMTSINGTISMRAFLIGTGEENFPRFPPLDAALRPPPPPAIGQAFLAEISRRKATVSKPSCLALATITSTLVAAVSRSNFSFSRNSL